MRCGEIIRILEELAPRDYACDWDNPGLLAGRRAKGVRKILVAVDADDEAVELAVQGGADMLLTHHPLIFHPLKQINDGDFIGRRLLTLIGADISYYAMHTNFDIAPGCMGDLAAERLGLSGCAPLEVTGTDLRTGTELVGIGKVGRLPQPMTGAEIAGLVKERFGLPFVTAYGLETAAEPVEYVAISPGSGGSMVAPALKSVARVLVTGDIGHHTGIDAAAQGLAVIDAGHYGVEHIFMDFMAGYLREKLGDEVTVETAPLRFPERVL